MDTPVSPDLKDLLALISRLRAPDGCPWDRQQTLGDLRAYLLEEAHEAAAALDSGDRDALREELGDLLFQIAFVGRLAEEEGSFRLADAVRSVHAKMVRRHPHVFATGSLEDADAVHRAWERRKARERADGSLLDGVPPSLPALTAAYRLTQKAAGVGFDWPDVAQVLAKAREELAEVEEVLEAEGSTSPPRDALAEEIGDLLLAVANLARHTGVDPEAALARGNLKFRRRFAAVEQQLRRRGRGPEEATLEEMDALWDEVKDREPANG